MEGHVPIGDNNFELFSLGVTAEALQANIEWKLPFC